MTYPNLTIEKPKLRRGLSYVLRTSRLEQALQEARVECPVSLLYWTPQPGGSVLQAFYWTANPHVPYGRVHIRAGTVASEHRQDAELQRRDRGMPIFVRWLQTLAALPRNSTVLRQEPSFAASYVDGDLEVWSTPPVGTPEPRAAGDVRPDVLSA